MAGCGDGIIDGESNIIYGMSVCARERERLRQPWTQVRETAGWAVL